MWYVNFKEQYKAWSKEQSFILTMWYVNSYNTMKPGVAGNTFYINYVICNLYDLVILDKESSVLY